MEDSLRPELCIIMASLARRTVSQQLRTRSEGTGAVSMSCVTSHSESLRNSPR